MQFHARTYWGLLYETDFNKPQLVRVPLYLGKTSANSLDDLDTDYWIRTGSFFTQCFDLDENRLHVVSGGTPYRLHPPLTIYYSKRIRNVSLFKTSLIEPLLATSAHICQTLQ